jgi:NADPH:quinone reductase
MRAIVVTRTGGPEVLEARDEPDPQPGPGQLLVELEAAGVNFRDIYEREGAGDYSNDPPFVAGAEGAGRVAAVGDGVHDFSVGDRVAWAAAPGSYAERVVVDEAKAVPVPDGVTTEVAAAALLQGMTAHYLAIDTYAVKSGDPVLVHAAAGGVGTAAIQVARALNARVVAAVGSPEKLELCRELGAEEAYVYDEIPDDLRVDVVVDPVGGELFEAAVGRLRPLGQLVAIGYAGGLWPELQPAHVVGRNVGVQGVYIGRLLRHAPDVIAAATRELLELWSSRRIRPVVGAEFLLADVEQAHELVESRRSVGKVVLVP